jgi:hypothetical protein
MKYPIRISCDNAGAPAFSIVRAEQARWNIPKSDRAILRELAKRYVELASDPVNKERITRMRDMNDLKPGRPPVWIDEIPWHELNIENQLTLLCESDEGKAVEEFFRQTFFQWKYFQADMVIEDTLYILKTYSSSGIGIGIKEETRSTDSENAVVSHHYEDQLDTDEKVEGLAAPVVRAYPEIDRRNLEILSEIFDGIIPVKLRGYYVDYSPWEHMSEFRGVNQSLENIIDDPDFIHRTMKKFADLGLSYFDQFEAEGLLDFNVQKVHCTPAYTGDIPAKDYDGGPARFKDTWLRTRAQMFCMVSPAMRDEFDLQYIRPFLDRCGPVYYGCCEPLELCVPHLRKIPNMRKIGASPWAKIPALAEQIGSDYVLARKPNPAAVAVDLNEDALKAEITETVEACIKSKCPYEFVLKDISTIGRKPQNLFNWVTITNQVLDSYYK